MYSSVVRSLLFLLLLGAQGLCNTRELIDDSRITPECLSKVDNIDNYRYLVRVLQICKEHTLDNLGIIISKSHVIAKTNPNWESGKKCRFTVLSRTNARGEGGERHGANVTRIGDRAELSLFKLKHPIKIGTHAQVIPVAAKRPQQGTEVLFNSWIRNMWGVGGEGVIAINATVAEQYICHSFLSGDKDLIDETNFFCTIGFENPCPARQDSALIYNGQLVGIMRSYYQPTPTSNEWIYRYYDVSLYRDTIMCLIGDM